MARADDFVATVVERPRLYVGLAIVGLIAHLSLAKPEFGPFDRILAWFLFAIFLSVLRDFAIGHASAIPIRLLFAAQLYLFYGFAQFTQAPLRLANGGYYIPAAWAVTAAMTLVILSAVLLFAALALGARVSRASHFSLSDFLPAPKPHWGIAVFILGCLGTLQFLLSYIWSGVVPTAVRNILQTMANPYLAFTLVFIYAQGTTWRPMVFLKNVMFAIMLTAGLLSGMLEAIMIPVYLLVINTWLWGRRLQAKWLVFAVAAFLVLNPVKYRYRAISMYEPIVASLSDVRHRLSLWSEAFLETLHDPLLKQAALENTSNRTTSIYTLAQVIEWVPAVIPHKRGAGFTVSILYWVPRFMWPSKPSVTTLINDRYALEFGLTSVEGLQTTTFGITQPLDGYWDFGWPGALAFFAATGFMVGFFFEGRGADTLRGRVLAVAFSATFFQILLGFFQFLASLTSFYVGVLFTMHIIRVASAARANIAQRSSFARPRS